jgi:hypothetical protein
LVVPPSASVTLRIVDAFGVAQLCAAHSAELFDAEDNDLIVALLSAGSADLLLSTESG